MSDEPQIPDPIAAMDQALANFGQIAKTVRAHYVAMLEHGFAPDQALTLSVAFQHSLLVVGAATDD